MKTQADIRHYFSAACNADDLWQRLHSILADYGIAYIFYGITHVAFPRELEKIDPSTELVYFKSSFPKDMLVDDIAAFPVCSDLGVLHCIRHTTPRISSKTSMWLSDEERKKRIDTEAASYSEDRWYKESMRIGVTIPLRFGGYGKGGLGLQVASMSSEDFDQVWGESKDQLTHIAKTFDELARIHFDLFDIKLTKREKEIVFWLSQGCSAKTIACQLGTKANTVENQVIAARKKLNAANNVQLVAKALTLELI